MERPKPENSQQYNEQQRDPDITGEQLYQAIEYVDRLERSLDELDQASRNFQSALKKLDNSIRETTFELNQVVEWNTQYLADEYTGNEIQSENDVNPVSKDQSIRAEKTRAIEFDL